MSIATQDDLLMTKDRRLTIPLRFAHTPRRFHSSVYTLNAEEVVSQFASREERLAHLRMHGLPVPADAETKQFIRQYVVGVFQCEAIFTYVSDDTTLWLAGGQLQRPRRFRQIHMSEKNPEAARMRRLAIRAVYALGLDYGVVRLGKATRGKPVVLDVIARPKLNSTMSQAFRHAVNAYAATLSRMLPSPSELLLGADPEFILVGADGRLKMASKYFGRHGLVGCDAIWHGANRADKPIVEIRPQASKTTRELTVRLYRGMWLAAKRINEPGTKWLAGALPYPGLPIGGHIHFSGVPLNSAILRVLDNYLTLPLVLIEDERGIRRRPTYGFLGDFRKQFHGGFEYRTPPSWLVSPTLTKGLFSLAKVIALNYPYMKQRPLQHVSVQKAYYKGDKEAIYKFVPRLWREILQLRGYKEERPALDALYNFLMSGKAWDEQADIRRKWRIPPYHKRTRQ